MRATFPHPDGMCARVSGDGATLVTACRDHKLYVWDVAAGKSRYSLPCKDVPRTVSIHPDGRTFLAIQPGGVAVIDVATGKPRFHIDQGVNAHVYFALYSADGRWILTSDNHARVLVWHAKDGARRATVRRAYAYNALAFEPRPAGWRPRPAGPAAPICSASASASRPARKGPATPCLPNSTTTPYRSARKPRPSCLAWGFWRPSCAPPRKRRRPRRCACGRAGYTEQIVNSHFEELPALPGLPEGLAFSPDGKRMASGCVNGSTYVWD